LPAKEPPLARPLLLAGSAGQEKVESGTFTAPPPVNARLFQYPLKRKRPALFCTGLHRFA
jgi:hypothetical protein